MNWDESKEIKRELVTDASNLAFCCLGLKAFGDHELELVTKQWTDDEDNVDTYPVYMHQTSDEILKNVEEKKQYFFTSMNDSANLSFEQIAWMAQKLRYNMDEITNAAVWIQQMDELDFTRWIHMLTSGKYAQCGNRLAKQIDEDCKLGKYQEEDIEREAVAQAKASAQVPVVVEGASY